MKVVCKPQQIWSQACRATHLETSQLSKISALSWIETCTGAQQSSFIFKYHRSVVLNEQTTTTFLSSQCRRSHVHAHRKLHPCWIPRQCATHSTFRSTTQSGTWHRANQNEVRYYYSYCYYSTIPMHHIATGAHREPFLMVALTKSMLTITLPSGMTQAACHCSTSKLRRYEGCFLKFGIAEIDGKLQCVSGGDVLAQMPAELGRPLHKASSQSKRVLRLSQSEETEKQDNPSKVRSYCQPVL